MRVTFYRLLKILNIFKYPYKILILTQMTCYICTFGCKRHNRHVMLDNWRSCRTKRVCELKIVLAPP